MSPRLTTSSRSDQQTPAYTLAEAARYLRLPSATLRAWVLGRQYPTANGGAHFHPLIRPASRQPLFLSFSNLIQAHVLRSLRTEHGVSVKELRSALKYAERELSLDGLLLRPELRANAGKLFVDRYGALIELSASGQLAMRHMFHEHLKRVEWNSDHPMRFYPFLWAEAPREERPIVIDPRLAFGRPVVARQKISTSAIAERVDAGESVEDLAADYDLVPSEIEQAVLYERAA